MLSRFCGRIIGSCYCCFSLYGTALSFDVERERIETREKSEIINQRGRKFISTYFVAITIQPNKSYLFLFVLAFALLEELFCSPKKK